MDTPGTEGLLVWDGNCGFCAWSLRVLLRLGATCDHAPYQQLELDGHGLSLDEARRAAWFVDADGTHEGHEAIARALRTSRHGAVRVLGGAVDSRPVGPVAGPAYRWVARHRGRIPYPGRRQHLPRA